MIADSGKYYLYRHIRLDKNEPFYIGIGTKRRFSEVNSTYERAFSKKGRNKIWKDIVFKTDYAVQILFESSSYDFIKEKEKEFIKIYGRKNLNKGSLSNLTDGGEGVLNAVISDETRLKISLSSKGRVSPNKGKQWSQEFKNKISNSLKGNKLKKESIEKRTNTLKQKAIERGYYQDNKWKENIGKANSKAVYVLKENVIQKFESCHKAGKVLEISFQMVSYACKKFPSPYKNMYFSYEEEKIKQFTQK